MMLGNSYAARAMNEALIPVLERLARLTPVNSKQSRMQNESVARLAELRRAIGAAPSSQWSNLNELTAIVNDLLAHGRAETAAEYLERATASEARPWEDANRIATLWLHLGEPAQARTAWQKSVNAPRPGLREARVAVTYLVEQTFESARDAFRSAIAADPELFEAHFGLAVLEQDAGRAAEALIAARQAVKLAPNDTSRSQAQAVVTTVTPYAHAPIAGERGKP
jgi:tetratricopeptide (TPR) repeat protein